MSKTKKRIITLICILTLMVVSALSVFGVQYRCIGGGKTDVESIHYWGANSHYYFYSTHNVEAVNGGGSPSGGYQYYVFGHQYWSCGGSDYSESCPTGRIINW